MLTNEHKKRIITALEQNRRNYPSDAKMAVAFGINSAQLSRIKKGEFDGVISDAKWVSLARLMDVTLNDEFSWNIARTPTYDYVIDQLETCQQFSIAGLLCDRADIGKSFAAKHYARTHRNAVYVDCAQVKHKQKLVRKIAKEFGVGYTGRYADVYDDLVYYLNSITTPLIELDEAGDLEYSAFLELKALWNSTERRVGWYMMGADGLKRKIERNLEWQKVGYAELFSRYGNRYQRITPAGKEEQETFMRAQTAIIATANGAGEYVQEIYAKTGGSLRRIFVEIQKLRQSGKLDKAA